MSYTLLTTDIDPMGQAIADFHTRGRADKLIVSSPDFDDDELPVATLFRTYDRMNALERLALQNARGRVLDVGAGSGCHSLVLMERGLNVDAIDISPLAVEVMRDRGVSAAPRNLFDTSWGGSYDTILLLMNGSGIVGRLERMGEFFARLKQLLAPDGIVLLDSSDLRYLYEDEDGSYLVDLAGDYYGELTYSMRYRKVQGKPFPWLYVDFDTLSLYASQYGFEAECLATGEHYDYLACLRQV